MSAETKLKRIKENVAALNEQLQELSVQKELISAALCGFLRQKTEAKKQLKKIEAIKMSILEDEDTYRKQIQLVEANHENVDQIRALLAEA